MKKRKGLLSDPLYNKGSAFSDKERNALGLNGLLPAAVLSIEAQVAVAYANFSSLQDPLAKYQYLAQLQNFNEILFYRLVEAHVAEMLPIIYTPTVGSAAQKFSEIYPYARGLYLSYLLRNKMKQMIDNLAQEEVEVIVVTDGERILGLGDLGIGGMAIPIGKLALYTLFAGIHPAKVLPIVLDVGTNNETLLKSPSYLGWKHKRLRGKSYEEFVAKFVSAIKKRYPSVLLQWEDFGKINAAALLEKYRNKICSFNDDIQGTASVALAAILTASRVKKTSLKQERFAILGAGSAGLGIAKKIWQALLTEGLNEKEAAERLFIIEREGLIHDRVPHMDSELRRFAHSYESLKSWKVVKQGSFMLLDVVKNAKPTVLIGVSAQGGAFSEEILRAMASSGNRPAIFPLSNPNSRSEATPEDILKWTDGKAIIATGSPFPPVTYKGKAIKISQCNNVYIFPGIGLGVIASKTPKVTDSMFLAAAKTLASFSPMLKDPSDPLFPSLEKLRAICRKIALEVFQVAIQEKLVPKVSKKEMEKRIDQKIWKARYSK